MNASFVLSLIAICFKGNMYTTGEAGKVDLTKAAEYFTKAAEKGMITFKKEHYCREVNFLMSS